MIACRQHLLQVFEEGEFVLREGDELGSDAKFYLIASGTVTCHKTFEVLGSGVLTFTAGS